VTELSRQPVPAGAPTGPVKPAFWRRAVAVAMTAATLAVGLAFLRYLHNGVWLGPWDVAVWPRSLGEAFLRPLSILEVPWLIVVHGAVLGLCAAMPIVAAASLRLRWSLLLASLILIVGQSPVLAVTVAGGCVLARSMSVRNHLPTVGVLMGLLPAGIVYLAMFALSDMRWDTAATFQRWIRYLPLAVAVITAILLTVFTQVLRSERSWAGGRTWPIAAVMLAGAIGLFYWQIGADELRYASLTDELAPGDAMFEAMATDEWRQRHDAPGLQTDLLNDHIRAAANRRRDDLARACGEFIERHAQSVRAPEVLWVQGQAGHLRLDESALAGGWVQTTAAYPSVQSRPVWEKLILDYPTSDLVGLGYWRLGQMAALDGDIAKAASLLSEAEDHLRAKVPADVQSDADAAAGRLFNPPGKLPSRSYYRAAYYDTTRLLWLIRENRLVSDRSGGDVFAAMMNVNPYAVDAHQQYAQLAKRHTESILADNLALAVALSAPTTHLRAELLKGLAEGGDEIDARVEANYQLGLILRSLREGHEGYESSEVYFARVDAAGDSPWRHLATEQLAWRNNRPGRGE